MGRYKTNEEWAEINRKRDAQLEEWSRIRRESLAIAMENARINFGNSLWDAVDQTRQQWAESEGEHPFIRAKLEESYRSAQNRLQAEIQRAGRHGFPAWLFNRGDESEGKTWKTVTASLISDAYSVEKQINMTFSQMEAIRIMIEKNPATWQSEQGKRILADMQALWTRLYDRYLRSLAYFTYLKNVIGLRGGSYNALSEADKASIQVGRRVIIPCF